MAETWGQILRFLGIVLNGIYQAIPSYGIAIILLTLAVRLLLFPLGVKQIRSMTAMQRIQPKVKELQKKHKGDRQRLNEEMMKLYREHGVNPLGGCFPMLLQLPVFIALYAVIRSVVPFTATLPTPVAAEIQVTKSTVCRPVGTPEASGPGFTDVKCESNGKEQTFTLSSIQTRSGSPLTELPSYVTKCVPAVEQDPATKQQTIKGFSCASPVGTGHLPKNGKLFAGIVQDRASFLGMHLACSPTQATSKQSIRQCTAAANAAGGIGLVSYYGLVLLMALTTWYQQKQMMSKTPQQGPQAAQMQMMTRIMPVFMGFLSLNFPSALSLYWVVGNVWMIGQQHFTLRAHEPPEGGVPAKPAKPTKGGKPKPTLPSGPKLRRRPEGRPGKSRR